MPLREYGCSAGHITEKFYHTTNLDETPKLIGCGDLDCWSDAKLMFSAPQIDTASTFHPFEWTGPDKQKWSITNLHKLRQVEKVYEQTPYKCRFDAYSADPSNPDAEDGFGLPPWDGLPGSTEGKGFSLPVRDD
jgi:hypothetical protein